MGYTVEYENRDGHMATRLFNTYDEAQRFIAVQLSKGLRARIV